MKDFFILLFVLKLVAINEVISRHD